jgi:hypothetical protein
MRNTMNEYFSKVKLNTKVINNLRDIVSMLEHDIDSLENLNGVEENNLKLVRERVFKMINLVANIEEDIQIRIKCQVADYFNDLYAEISDIEAYLENLHKRRYGWDNYTSKEVEF